MAICPIKILKDEQGKDFVPLTHMRAVSGAEYVTSTLMATQDSAGNFTIEHEDLVDTDLINKIVGVTFPASITASTNGYKLRLKNSATTYDYFTIYIEDGKTAMDVNKYIGTVCLLRRNSDSWQLVKTGVVDLTNPGHIILNASGNALEYRSQLKFTGMNVTNNSTNTTISPVVINNLTTATAGNGALDATQGKILNEKFNSYLPLTGGTLTGSLTATTFIGNLNGNATSANSAQSATTASTANKVANNLTLKQNNVNTIYNGESAKSLNIPTVHSGASAPSTSTGQDGDIYILII